LEKFSIVTSDTSLIVLETLQQHLQHKIPPSKSRTKMYNDYMSRIRQEDDHRNSVISQKLSTIQSLYNDRLNWWNKERILPTSSRQRLRNTNTKQEVMGNSNKESENVKDKSAPLSIQKSVSLSNESKTTSSHPEEKKDEQKSNFYEEKEKKNLFPHLKLVLHC